MSWRSSTGSAFAMPIVLAMTLSLAGCLTTRATLIGGTEGRIVSDVCSVWKPVTYSSRDTEQTRLEARANNAARNAYCKED